LWYVDELTKQGGRSKKARIWNCTVSPKWVAIPVEPIVSKFGYSLHLTNLIIQSKSGFGVSSSFGSTEVQILPYPMGTASRHHHMQPSQSFR
jgi:hypothetical protein